MEKDVVFTAEFRGRLIRLFRALISSLAHDRPSGDLWLSLFSVYSFIRCSGFSRCIKKVFKHD